jgi:hypothetical protein
MLAIEGYAMSYFPGKIGEINISINHYGGMKDNFIDLFPNSFFQRKMIKYAGNVNQTYLQ